MGHLRLTKWSKKKPPKSRFLTAPEPDILSLMSDSFSRLRGSDQVEGIRHHFMLLIERCLERVSKPLRHTKFSRKKQNRSRAKIARGALIRCCYTPTQSSNPVSASSLTIKRQRHTKIRLDCARLSFSSEAFAKLFSQRAAHKNKRTLEPTDPILEKSSSLAFPFAESGRADRLSGDAQAW
jgi:hypothetical protein